MIDPPKKIGKYDILGVIGQGGMGVVFKAHDPQIGRFVAIKMITASDPSLVGRFYNEARSTGRLQHPNIVTVYDFGDHEGNPFLVMQFLEGVSLESLIASGNELNLIEKLEICSGICNGLQYAHEQGVIHRDIKPANIIVLKDGTAVIVDFGIARIGTTGASRTALIGSLHYMSPEQFRSLPIDFRTDIFSAGVLLYRVLTGALPFDGLDEASVMHQIIYETQKPIASHVMDCPPELEGVVTRALAKDREERFQSARDFGVELLIIQDKLKRAALSQVMQRAESAVHQGELSKAQDYLFQILKIDKNYLPAHRLLADVQSSVRRLKRSERVLELTAKAQDAFVLEQFDTAIKCLEEALSLDDTNVEVRNLRERVSAEQSRRSDLHKILSRAQAAHKSGNLDEALRTVDEILRLDPEETSAQALRILLTAELKKQEQLRNARSLREEARRYLSVGDVTNALQSLELASGLDPESVELLSLKRAANSAQEQRNRRDEVRRLKHEIGQILAREDYAAALNALDKAQRWFPDDPGLVQLRGLVEAQRQKIGDSQRLRRRLEQQHELAQEELEEERAVTQPSSSATEILLHGTASDTERLGGPNSTADLANADFQILPAAKSRSSNWIAWTVAALVLVLLAGVLVTRLNISPKPILVQIHITPRTSAVRVDGVACTSPCTMQLAIGSHTLTAQNDGYVDLNDSFVVQKGGRSSFNFELTPRPTPPAIGTIGVQTNIENAEILIDGSPSGHTDAGRRFSIRVSAGLHEVTARMAGYKNVIGKVDVQEGREARLDLTLEKGTSVEQRLLIRGLPGAEVKVDQRSAVLIPSSGNLQLNVDPGEHTIAARKDGYEPDPWTNRARVKPGIDSLITISMVPKPEQPKPAPPTQPTLVTKTFPPPTDTFTVSPDTIEPGKSAQLTWETRDASEVTIDGEKVELKGSRAVTASKPRTFTLVAKGDGGTSKDTAFLNVAAPEPPKVSATVPNSESVSEMDKAAIQPILNRYAEVYIKRKAKSLKEIWPGVSPSKISDIQSFIDSTKRLDVSLKPQKWDLHGTGIMVTCQQSMSFERNGKPEQHDSPINIYVVKSQGAWVISDIPRSAD